MKQNNFWKDFVLAIVIVFSLLIIAFFSSCTSSKKVDKSKETVVIKREYVVDSTVYEKIDSIKKHYEERIKSLDNTIDFWTPGDDLVDYPCDTIKEIIPRIIYKSDGSFEAVGVKRANLKLFDSQKKYDSLSVEYNLEVSKNLMLREELKSSKKEVVKEKKSPSGWWILILIIITIVSWEVLRRKIKF